MGIDLGGTKIAICIMDSEGNIKDKLILPTQAQDGPKGVIRRIIDGCLILLEREKYALQDITAVGVAAPGPIDFKRGITKKLPNLPGWKDIPLLDIIKDKFKLPVFLENDANAAALAESLYGTGRGVDNLVYITISTGIGAGVIANGSLLRGAQGNAAEIGHMTINFDGPRCGCGNKGCWEAYASGTALARFAREGIASGRKTLITNLSEGQVVKAEHVFSAAKLGDEFARELILKEGFYLGVGLANVVNAYNPSLIALGGGVTGEWDVFYDQMMKVMRERAFEANVDKLKVVKASLGAEAGMIGAAAVALNSI